MANFLSPLFNEQTFTANGDPAVGYKVNTYEAGTSTPIDTFTTKNGSTAQSNPIVLNARGAPDDVIWLAQGVSYKFVLTDANDVVIDTFDNISGINDTSVSSGEWTASGYTPTYIGATSFSLVGDRTGEFLVGRRVRSTNTGGTTYSLITGSSYSSGTGLTTVTLSNDSGTLDAGLSVVDLAILTPDNPSLPNSQEARQALGLEIGVDVAAAGSVTSSGQTMATSRLLGRTTASTGAVEEIQVSGGLALAAGALSLDAASTAEMQTGTSTSKAPSVAAIRGGLIVLNASEATTSGTFKDKTGIPSWANKIRAKFTGLSTNGSSFPMVQAIVSGSPVTSGYTGSCNFDGGGGNTLSNLSTGVLLASAWGASSIISGELEFSRFAPGSNTWTFKGQLGFSNAVGNTSVAGHIALAGDIEGLRLTTVGGTDAMDAGAWAVDWK